MPDTIRLVDPDGVERDVPLESAGTVLQDQRWRLAQTEDTLGRLSQQAKEIDYGGAGGALAATGAAIARGATLGLSDVAARALGGDQLAIDLGGYRDVNPGLSAAGEIAGAIAPALVSGGALAPAGMAARAGRGIAALGEGAGAAGRIGAATLGGAAEGGLYGLGSGVSELALSQDPLTLEHAASTLSSSTLYGAAAGSVAGGGLKSVEVGLGAAKRAIDRALLERSGARAMRAVGELESEAAAAPAEIGPETDVTILDRKGLRLARDRATEAANAAQEPERKAFVDELRASREASLQEKTWLSTQFGKTREVRNLGRATLKADRRIDALLDVERDLIDRPQRARLALLEQEQALTRLQEWGERETQHYLDEVAGARDKIRGELLDNQVKGYRFGKGGISRESPVIDDIVERLFQERYPDPSRLPTNLQVLGALPSALERNRALQDRLASLAKPPISPQLAAIDAAEHALDVRTGAPKAEPEPSLGAAVLSAAAPFAGPLGAAATATRALGGLRKAAAAGAERLGRAASNFLATAAPAVGKAAKFAPAVATKVLSQLRYGEPEKDERGKPKPGPEPTTLPDLYKARSTEIKAQTELAPDGTYRMRQAAREKMASKLAGLGAVDPVAADRMESAGAKRIAWLASQLPRRPDITAVQIGPDTWTPSDIAMRTFARKAAAAEDPIGVLERAVHGRVTPAEVAALRATAPEILTSFINTVLPQLAALPKKLPYDRRLSLSMLTGVPVDPAMHPGVLRELQSMYAGEPGTAGGTQEPAAQAQFGSVKRSDPGTPAQRREGLTA